MAPFEASPIDLMVGAVVLPPIIAVVNQAHWPAPVKGVVAAITCCISALIAVYLRGPVHVATWRDTAMLTALGAFGAYRIFWRPTGLAPVLEAITTVGHPVPTGVHRMP